MSNTFLTEEDKERLEYTINTRLKLIKKITGDGEEIILPKDQGDQIMLMQALADTDATILKRARLIIEDEKNKGDSESNKILTEILKNTSVNRRGVVRTSIPVLPDDVPIAKVNPGELEYNPEKLTYQKFKEEVLDN